MTLENTIQYLLDFYPDTFATREHVLLNLFIVDKNEFKWLGGELKQNTTHNDDSFDFVNIQGQHYKITPLSKVSISFESTSNIIRHDTLILKWCQKTGLSENEWWSVYIKNTISMKSHIFNIPSDLKPEWLCGIKETENLCIKYLGKKEWETYQKKFNS